MGGGRSLNGPPAPTEIFGQSLKPCVEGYSPPKSNSTFLAISDLGKCTHFHTKIGEGGGLTDRF